MSLGAFLNHRISIVRSLVTLDGDGDVTLDEYGAPVVTRVAIASDVAAGLQPKTAREIARISQAGVVVGSWTLYMRPRDVTEADSIVHTAADCPQPAGRDLPDSTWNITGIRMAAGVGHHLEIDATLVESGESAIEPAVVGS